MAKQTYVGKGKIHIGPYDRSSALLFVGNCSQLDLNISENRFALPDNTSPGGGDYDTVRRVESAQFALTNWEYDPRQLANYLRGTQSLIAAGAVAAEAHKAYIGGLVPADFVPDPALAFTVHAGGGAALVEGVDYKRTPTGIVPLAGGAIADATNITFDYTKVASTRIEALTQSAKPYKMYFEGLNEADSGRPVILRLHRIKLGVAQTVPFLTSEFGSYNIGGDVLKDDAIQGVGLSQFFQVDQAVPA